MKNLRVLSIQDVSCYGQCSLTVALPILSSVGIETVILPTAILSTHTAGFKGFTFRDLKGDLPAIVAHWKKEGIQVDAVYTGYLGHEDDVKIVLDIASSPINKGPLIVDPAFGDKGVLYGGFDLAYVASMRGLVAKADILLPNLTEACFLLDIPYVAKPDEKQIDGILLGLSALGAKTIVLKGIGAKEGETGLVIYDGKEKLYYSHRRIDQDFHGTGDVFASSFVGAYMRGLTPLEAGKLAADFTCEAILNTKGDESHTYGVKFEPLLFDLESKVRLALKA